MCQRSLPESAAPVCLPQVACPGRDATGKPNRPVGGLTERGSRRDDGGMERFVDDDAGYRDWLARHPDGFVINTGRTPTAAYLMLHRAACGSISGTPARGSTFTGDYAKVCGGREELEGFGRQLGGEAKPCGLCLNQAAQSLRRAPGGGKYGPLRDHLAGCAGSRVRLTFAEVE